MHMTSIPSVLNESDTPVPHTKGIPKDLVVKIQRSFGISEFVETGTYMGETAIWASEIFRRVITVEQSRHYYEQLEVAHSRYPNVEFVFGHSGVDLDRLVRSLAGPAVFWLDGHWSGGKTYGEGDECPLLNEIESINRSPHEHFIFIDDARLFMSPPPRPHSPDDWPTIVQVVDILRAAGRSPYVVAFADVIIACPGTAKSLISEWCQIAVTQLWEAESRNTAQRSTSKSESPKQLILKGAHRIAKAFLPRNQASR